MTTAASPSRSAPASVAPSSSQTIHLHNRAHRPFAAQGVTYGVPWPQGAVKDTSELVLRDHAGTPLPAGFTELNRWPDGSLQWTLLDASLDLGPSANVALTIEKAPGKADATAKAPAPAHPVHAEVAGGTARIGNGLVEIEVTSKVGELLKRWAVGGQPFVVEGGFDVSFKDAGGREFSLSKGGRTLSLEHANPLRAVLRIDGRHGSGIPGGGEQTLLLDYFVRIEVRAGRSDVKVTHSFRNRELPVPGVEISSFYAEFKTALPQDSTRCFTANTRTRHYLTQPMRVAGEDPVIVASDTGDIERYTETHKEKGNADVFVRNPEVLHDPVEEKPWWLRDIKFRLLAGGSKCVWPYLAIVSPQGGAVACVEGMSSLHPKELTVRGSTFRMGLYPEWAGPLKITQGAGRSHAMHLGPLAADASDLDIQNLYLSWDFGGIHTHIASATTVEIAPDLEHVRRCGVFAIDLLPAYEPDERFGFERKVLDAWIGISYGQLGAVDQVAQWPAAGFWHYGDQGLGNNEEMHNLVYFQNYFRTGNWGCAEHALNGTRHMLEVDHCAFSTDAYQHGGQVAHTTDHNDGTAYPSHMWFTEYLFAYALTGDREFLEGARRACENLLHWIDDEQGWAIIAADQREAGQPMINLTWCYEFLNDPRYLEGCRKIVREYLMANTRKYGRMLDGKPFVNPVKVCSYGDYAAWEGMFWLWRITGDEELKRFMLGQLEWRLQDRYMGVHGFHRATDYNPAAYAYYMTGDKTWVERVARPFRFAFKAAKWPLGWVHAMYYTKLAFDLGIVKDEDITVQ